MIELSVVIPCFNESNNLPIIYENIKKKLFELGYTASHLIVN